MKYYKLIINDNFILSENLLELLSNSDITEVRVVDEYHYIRMVISNRDDLPRYIIKQLSNDYNFGVRYNIARRKNLSKNIIEKLSNDSENIVRAAIKETYNL